jgi:predicted DNA-binding transcriptional regulator YafY
MLGRMRSQQKDAARNAQLERVLNIVRDLDRMDGVDLYELASRYGAGLRTIRRDLEAIQAAGLPIEGERDGKRKRYRIAYRDRVAKLSSLLDASHYLALRVAMGQVGAAAQASGLFAKLEDLADKIEAAVGEKGRARLEVVERCFHPWDKHAYREAAKEHFWPLVDAIAEGEVCRVTYRAPHAPPEGKTYEVLPLRLFVHDRAVYLLHHNRKHREIGTLNLQRLLRVERTGRHARPPADFDPTEWEASTFGIFPGGKPTTYVLRFHSEVAPFIRERVWHPSQKLRELRGGGVELTFTCGESYEVTSWVASWREWVEVGAPDFLVAELCCLGQWLSRRYARRRLNVRRGATRGSTRGGNA